MVRKLRRSVKSLAVLVLFLLPFTTLLLPVSAYDDTFRAGPTLDRIQYFVITQNDQRRIALEDDEIDVIGDYVKPQILDGFGLPEELEIATSLRNGYDYITINCNKYPLNESSFRRAFAFALDKQRIVDDVWDGLAAPQDSCIPDANLWSSEGLLDFTYYESDIDRGNTILDQAGFSDIDGDSIREAPNGSEIHVFLELVSSSSQAAETGEIALDALQALNVNATLIQSGFGDYFTRLYFHGDYDMMILGSTMRDFDIRWMAYDFWSEFSKEPYWNFPNWHNSTFDSWRDQFLHATSYEEVYEAAIEMQRIWVQDCPMIICQRNTYLTAYRNDHFTNFTLSSVQGAPGFWTNQKVRLHESLGGPFGGTLRYSLSQDLTTWNIILAHELSKWVRQGFTQGRSDLLVLNELYDSLFVQAPNGTVLPWLVDSYGITTHDDNPSIAENMTRFTLDLIDGFTWSDGSPLTAEDIERTLNYYRQASGNPFEEALAELRAVYTPTSGTLVIEFAGESYWHLYDFAYLPILPRMITEETDPEDWDEWDILQFGEDLITSGPFNLTTYEEGEFIELSRNPDYYYARNLVINITDTIPSDGFAPFDPYQYILDNLTAFAIILGCTVGIVTILHFLRKETG
ncbi:MAG: hypothetical protein KAR33_08180 [Candidatus Thorarchaeota archaeon]|nr:hypothetical protein [Candidatus Thorarchaeota archaeon]